MAAPTAGIPRPHNEAQRVLALRRLGILDTPPEARFDRIVKLAVRLFGVQFSYISLVDHDRQWVKAQQGAVQIGTSRDQSFCGYTILQRETMLVPDARQDPRFATNPMVEQDPFVRFYAGRPLRASAESMVGSLCLMDREPRTMTELELELLDQLGDLVEHEFRLVETLELQDKLLESQHQLALEKQKSDELLRNILPDHIADELKEKGCVPASLHPLVCVLFCDFTDFTRTTGNMRPEDVVRELNVCFTAFDEITEQFRVEKLKTMGDGYMCASGLFETDDEPAMRVLNAALAMGDFIEKRRLDVEQSGRPYWRLRVGIHAGPVVSGVVGKRKFAFDIWGDTVNIASRLETAGEPATINVSTDFLELVKDHVLFTPRGMRPLKGKDDRPMFFIDGLRP